MTGALDLRPWLAAGLPLDQAAAWAGADIEPHEAMGWLTEGYHAHEAMAARLDLGARALDLVIAGDVVL